MKQYNAICPGENPYINLQNTTALRRLRKEKRISMKELAEIIGISESKMSSVERGVSYVSPEELKRIADILETDIALISKDLKTTLIHKNLKPRYK